MSNAEKFMFIFSGAGTYQSQEETMKSIADWQKWIQELAQSDNFVSTEQLNPEVKKVEGKQKVVKDGPFTETKEIIGGIMIIKAKNFEHAIEISKACPIFDFNGTVEVRSIMQLAA